MLTKSNLDVGLRDMSDGKIFTLGVSSSLSSKLQHNGELIVTVTSPSIDLSERMESGSLWRVECGVHDKDTLLLDSYIQLIDRTPNHLDVILKYKVQSMNWIRLKFKVIHDNLKIMELLGNE